MSSGDDDDGHGAQDIELQERATLLGEGVANKRRADQLRRGSLKNKLAERWAADARCALVVALVALAAIATTIAASVPGGDRSWRGSSWTSTPGGLTFYFGTELPATAPRDAILDDGTGYSDGRDRGLSYGWNCDGDPDVDFSSGRRDVEFDSGLGINHFDRDGECAGPVNWEVGVPNGDYAVVVDFGEPGEDQGTHGCEVEGVLCQGAMGISGGQGWRETGQGWRGRECTMDGTVTVTDGRFTATGYSHDTRLCHSISMVTIKPAQLAGLTERMLKAEHDLHRAAPKPAAPESPPAPPPDPSPPSDAYRGTEIDGAQIDRAWEAYARGRDACLASSANQVEDGTMFTHRTRKSAPVQRKSQTVVDTITWSELSPSGQHVPAPL